MNPLAIMRFALRRTWDEYLSVIVLSALWLLAQVLIITGPPATAVLFAMARATREGVYWGAGDAWSSFRALFWLAWKWALPNALVIGLALYNLSTFWSVPGVIWAVLRVVWFLVLLILIGLNLFFWPFYLAAVDRSLRNTYANCIRFWLLHPGAGLVLLMACLVVIIVGVSAMLPVILGVMFWMALCAESAVAQSLALASD